MNSECRLPLPHKSLPQGLPQWYYSILAFDPTEIFARLAGKLDHFKRFNNSYTFVATDIMPAKKDGFCDCGCGQKLSGRQSRWASKDCCYMCYAIYNIIAGRIETIKPLILAYYFGDRFKEACLECGETDLPVRLQKNGIALSGIDIDHIVPVHKGGGACWLSNYRPLCASCHKAKTLRDRTAGQK